MAGVQKKCRSVRLQPAFRFISKKVVQGVGSLTFTPNFHFATGPKFGSQFEFFKVFGSAAVPQESVCDCDGIAVFYQEPG